MKPKSLLRLAAACLLLAFSACIKDTAYRTYTYRLYRPVFSTSAEVRANVKTGAPTPVTGMGKMYVLGNYIYLSDPGKGIHIINNTNPSNPVNESYIKIPGCGDMAVYGTTLYADCYTDMMVIDISNPKNAVLKTSIANMFPDRQYVMGYQMDSGKVVADWIEKDTTVREKMELGRLTDGVVYFDAMSFRNYSSSSSGSGIPQQGTGGSMARFAIQARHLYTVSTSDLTVLDIRNPENPEWKKKLNLGWGIETIYPFKDQLFVGSTSGMQIFSVSNPANPVKTGTFEHAQVCDPVIADDNYAYVTLRSGTSCQGFTNQLDVVSLKNANNPTLLKSYQLTNPHGLSKDGKWLFICDGDDGLKVFNANNASAITLVKRIDMASTYDVICLSGLALVSAEDGLYEYDYTDINNINLLSKTAIEK